MSTVAITKNAMLVRQSISVWTAVRTDKQASDTVAREHHVDARKAGKYRKNCIDTGAPEYVDVTQAAGKLKEAHYSITLPTEDRGVRILKASAHPEYCRRQRAAQNAFWNAVDAFEAAYPRLRAEAQQTLNGLFNPDDYPTDIRAKFGCRVTLLPFPSGEQFIIDMAERDAIQAQIDRDMEAAVAAAMRDPYERLHAAIGRMVNRLSDPKAVFHDTLVGNLLELVNVLPALNVTGDERLEELRQQTVALLAGVTAQQLRDAPDVRAQKAREAAAIERAMAAFMA